MPVNASAGPAEVVLIELKGRPTFGG
jgi:hypothetical protein